MKETKIVEGNETKLTLDEMLALAERIPDELWDFDTEIIFYADYMGFRVSVSGGPLNDYGLPTIVVRDLKHDYRTPERRAQHGYSNKEYSELGKVQSRDPRLRELFRKVKEQCNIDVKERVKQVKNLIKK